MHCGLHKFVTVVSIQFACGVDTVHLCVDTRIKGIDLDFCAHAPQGTLWTYVAIYTHDPCTLKHPTQESLEHSGRRQEEREKGICIQRSRAAPPREEEGEEEGEEEKELVIAAVLVQKEIQPSLYLVRV
ncbi:hypothetical protein Taro_020454 [Colocasia esculenta]|uniref:Uncharacterized protein n=1 Tax=Colocasia esculenta TaxID=4460 RepID=A0A843V598_COLES|nr:hypothetical protein [Colocasia esculenta]